MIRQAFSLTNVPFLPLRSSRELYRSKQVRELTAKLDRLIAHGGMALLSGETGSGKSATAHAFRLAQEPNRIWVDTLAVPALSPRALLRNIARLLAVDPAYHADTLLAQITDTLIEIRDQDKRQPMLIVEEAQAFDLDTLETLRRLVDLRHDGRPILTVLLVAHRDIVALLRQRRASALRQRLLFAYHLTGLARGEVKDYLTHQLKRVEAPRFPFTDDALAALFNHSQGLPRIINALATDAMYAAADAQDATISAKLVVDIAARREDLA